MADRLDPARQRLTEAIAGFSRAAERAVAVAADPKASRTAIDDARHQATFALAAVGMALKAALAEARPDDD